MSNCKQEYYIVYYNNIKNKIKNISDIEKELIHRDPVWVNGVLVNLPAEFHADGSKFWWKNGQKHRDPVMINGIMEDLPADIWADGTLQWCKNGGYHRDNDLPAAICPNGTKCWYKNGERHRDGDEPASIYAAGGKEWWVNGKRHRDRKLGPALIWGNGNPSQYFEDGVEVYLQ